MSGPCFPFSCGAIRVFCCLCKVIIALPLFPAVVVHLFGFAHRLSQRIPQHTLDVCLCAPWGKCSNNFGLVCPTLAQLRGYRVGFRAKLTGIRANLCSFQPTSERAMSIEVRAVLVKYSEGFLPHPRVSRPNRGALDNFGPSRPTLGWFSPRRGWFRRCLSWFRPNIRASLTKSWAP